MNHVWPPKHPRQPHHYLKPRRAARPPGGFVFGYHPLRSSSSFMGLPVSIKTPRLIRDRCGVFYFPLTVPSALRESVEKTEFRRSLRTKDSAISPSAAFQYHPAYSPKSRHGLMPQVMDIAGVSAISAEYQSRRCRPDTPQCSLDARHAHACLARDLGGTDTA